jgi:RHS repeat-associated protein
LAQSMVWRGHRIDPTGFYWLGARYYEPTSGRFLSPDPKGQAASMSLYDFCNGDPVNFFDPLGLQASGPNDINWNDVAQATARQGQFATQPNGTNGTAQLLVQAGATIVQDATVTVSANGAGASVGGDGSVGVNAGPVSITRDANGNIVMSASQSVGTVTGTVSTNSSSPSTVTASVTNGPPPVSVGPVSVSIDPSKGSIPNPSDNPVISNTNNGGDVNSPPPTSIGPVSVSVDPSNGSVNASIDLGNGNIQNQNPSPNPAVNSGSKKCPGN